MIFSIASEDSLLGNFKPFLGSGLELRVPALPTLQLDICCARMFCFFMSAYCEDGLLCWRYALGSRVVGFKIIESNEEFVRFFFGTWKLSNLIMFGICAKMLGVCFKIGCGNKMPEDILEEILHTSSRMLHLAKN